MIAKYSHVRCYWFWLHVKLIFNLIDLLDNLLGGIFAMCFDSTMEERQHTKQCYVLQLLYSPVILPCKYLTVEYGCFSLTHDGSLPELSIDA